MGPKLGDQGFIIRLIQNAVCRIMRIMDIIIIVLFKMWEHIVKMFEIILVDLMANWKLSCAVQRCDTQLTSS